VASNLFYCGSVLITAHGPSIVRFTRDGRELIFRTYDNARIVYTAGEYYDYDELPKEMGEPWNQ